MKNARNLKDLGDLIRLVRKKRNMTQEQLAKRCNVTQVAISKLETGQGATLQVFVQVMKALEVELSLKDIEKIDTDNLLGMIE